MNNDFERKNGGEGILRRRFHFGSSNLSLFFTVALFMAALIFILVLVAGGPLGEEIGWRGYLFRKLCLRLNPLLAAVMVGIVWAGWHIPMFVFHADGYEISFALYLLQTIFLSIIISTVFVKCGCSIWAAVLFHTIDNFVLSIGYQEALGTVCTYSICYWSLQGIIVLILGIVLARTKRSCCMI